MPGAIGGNVGIGGGGSGLKFRSPVDSFGTSASTRVQAEALRDAGLNAAAVAEFDADPTLNIILVYGTFTVYQSRRSGAWADNVGALRGPSGADGSDGDPGAPGGGAIESTGIVLDLRTVAIPTDELMATGLMLGDRGDTPHVLYRVEANTLSLLWFETDGLYDLATASDGDAIDTSGTDRNVLTLPESAGTSLSGVVYGGIADTGEFLIAFTSDDSDTYVEFFRYVAAESQGLTASERAELTRLSGVETGATTDQTGTEIKAAYEAEGDTNAYTDGEKSKLGGVAVTANRLIPYKIGNIYRAFASGASVTKPGNTEGTVTTTGITDAPVGWLLTRPEATAALPYVYDCHVYGYTTNGVFSWQFGTPNRTDRYIAPGGTGIDTSTANGLIQDALAAAVTGNTETGITVTYNADGTVDFVVSATPAPTHTNYLGLRETDAMFAAGDYTVSGQTALLTIPAYTGGRWLSFAFPETETVSEVYLYEPGHRLALNVLGSFPTEASVELGGSMHSSRSSVDALTGYGGFILEMVFA